MHLVKEAAPDPYYPAQIERTVQERPPAGAEHRRGDLGRST